jgi:hypothetical protein
MLDDPTKLSLRELLAVQTAVLEEIQSRGLTRTGSSLVGELAERITLEAFGGELVTAGQRAIDLIDGEGRTVQVKARALKPKVHRIYVLSSFDFDVLIACMFDRSSFELQWAREMSSEEAQSIARFRQKESDWAIATSKALRTGTDITDKMRAAYASLDGTLS